MAAAAGGPNLLVDKHGEPFVLRPLEQADRESLESMYRDFEPKRCAQGLPPLSEEQRTLWLDSVLGTGDHLAVIVGGKLRGHGMLIPFGPDAAELANFLHQAIRDRGIGTALNRALLALGRDRGIGRVWLSVEPSNGRAIRSYEKVGFRRLPSTAWAPEVEMEVRLDRDT